MVFLPLRFYGLPVRPCQRILAPSLGWPPGIWHSITISWTWSPTYRRESGGEWRRSPSDTTPFVHDRPGAWRGRRRAASRAGATCSRRLTTSVDGSSAWAAARPAMVSGSRAGACRLGSRAGAVSGARPGGGQSRTMRPRPAVRAARSRCASAAWARGRRVAMRVRRRLPGRRGRRAASGRV